MSSPAGKVKPNMRSTAVKRIMQEAAELDREAEGDRDFAAAPLEEDLFDWHCTIRGVEGSEFEGGIYHFRIVLPPQYPMKAPDIILLTPSGRFEVGKKICIDGLTSFHAGSWQPAWGVRTAILGLRSFWTQKGEALAAVGAIDAPKAERRRLAQLSRDWICPCCAVPNRELLPIPSLDKGKSGSAGSDLTDSAPTAQLASTPEAADVTELAIESTTVEASVMPQEPAEDTSAGAVPVSPPETKTKDEKSAEAVEQAEVIRLQPRISPAELAALTAQLPRPSTTSPRVPIWIDTCLGLAILAFAVLVARRLT